MKHIEGFKIDIEVKKSNFHPNEGIIKALLYRHYRKKEKAVYLADEVPTYKNERGDIVYIDAKTNDSHEIEIKLEKVSLLDDLKKEKHESFLKEIEISTNYFSFCVPEKLVELTLSFINSVNKRYGLIVVYPPISDFYFPYLRIVKNPERFFVNNENKRKLEHNIIKRMSNYINKTFADKYLMYKYKENP